MQASHEWNEQHRYKDRAEQPNAEEVQHCSRQQQANDQPFGVDGALELDDHRLAAMRAHLDLCSALSLPRRTKQGNALSTVRARAVKHAA